MKSIALFAALASLLASADVRAQRVSGTPDGSTGEPANIVRTTAPILEARRLDGKSPSIDGLLDDEAWHEASVAKDFVQFEPEEGKPASMDTEGRVLYGADAIYVALRAFDPRPDSIVGQLTRRDQDSYSDWLIVVIDSYFDRRTAFQFGVNPVGVKQDAYRFDDTQEDSSWDAVWDVATRIDDRGWTAEFRIPYSQLRFDGEREQTWGLNFAREIARLQETSVWAPLSQQESAVVSRFGELRGLEDLSPPRRLEVQPYTLGKLDRAPADPGNPFYDANDLSSSFGADLKYGLTTDLTLDVTINPDFGQVEADPAQVNLSAFETFYPEKRPFFIEGSNIFRFGIGIGDGDGANESLFYSRRVGRAPQGSADSRGGFVDGTQNTAIHTAIKLSGKTALGWSVGILNAFTSEEKARVISADGERFTDVIEPSANYTVARVQKDFRDGKSAAGGIFTATHRDGTVADQLGLRSRAYTGGFDARHRFGGDNWEIAGNFLISHVQGSAKTIESLQQAPARYFQRPDAGHLTLDPTRTSLSGWASSLQLFKTGGGFWRFGTGLQARSPNFETNDLGFMNETDYVVPFVWTGYHKSTPGAHLLNWSVNVNGWSGWTFGGEHVSLGGNVNGSLQHKSRWGGYAGIGRQGGTLSTGLLRGGPAMIREAGTNGWLGLWSDSRKALQVNWNNHWGYRGESESWNVFTSPNLRWRPSGRASVSLGPFLSRNLDDRQWVERVTDDDDSRHYVFARMDQTTVGLTGRVDYAFTPNLSLQVYAQPFVSAGDYEEFKRVADPRAPTYRARFQPLNVHLSDDEYLVDLDGVGAPESFDNPDFNFKQFRSNVVLRWEYRPGSELFLVWSQARDHVAGDGRFDFSEGLDTLFEQDAHNVFMLKVSYWMSP